MRPSPIELLEDLFRPLKFPSNSPFARLIDAFAFPTLLRSGLEFLGYGEGAAEAEGAGSDLQAGSGLLAFVFGAVDAASDVADEVEGKLNRSAISSGARTSSTPRTFRAGGAGRSVTNSLADWTHPAAGGGKMVMRQGEMTSNM